MASSGGKAQSNGKRHSRGRPSKDADGVGREALMEAAERVLRRLPPAEVTRLAIAEEAGVDPNLVRYYFGTVSHLISEVVLASHRHIFAAFEQKTKMADPIDLLRLRVSEWLRLFIDNPYHHQLLTMVMYADLASEEHAAWKESLDRSVGYTRLGLELGEKSGQLRTVEPRFLQIAMLGMTEFFANNGAILKDMFGPEATPESLRADYEAFLFDLVTNGLRPRAKKG